MELLSPELFLTLLATFSAAYLLSTSKDLWLNFDKEIQLYITLLQSSHVLNRQRTFKETCFQAHFKSFSSEILHHDREQSPFVSGSETRSASIKQGRRSQARSRSWEYEDRRSKRDDGTSGTSPFIGRSVLMPSTDQKTNAHHNLFEVFKGNLYWQQILYPEIRFNLTIEKGLHVYGDISELLLTVNTLLINAIEATCKESNPKIDLAILESEEQLVIVVMDNGIGIPKEIQGRIHEPFFTTKSDTYVAELGLYMIARLVTKIKGTIQVKDNPNGEGGTIFSVTIPVKRPMMEFEFGGQQVA